MYNEAMHWRAVNIMVRVFGIMCFIVGVAFSITALQQFFHPEKIGKITTLSGNAPLEMGIVSLFCFVLGVLFVSVKAYRPDLNESEKSNSKK